jgi:sugar phosphate isomerase/epimerase
VGPEEVAHVSRPWNKKDRGQLRFGYGTNGFADHRLDDTLELLAELGYDGVALTLDVRHLDPYAPDIDFEVRRIRRRLDELNLAVVIETGARFLLDPARKHQPTLMSSDGRERRFDLLRRAIHIGSDLGAEAVSFWSGIPEPGTDLDVAWYRLVEGCSALLDEAKAAGVVLGFEPEPGMLIDTLEAFDRLLSALDDDPSFALTLDLGHCHCIEDRSVRDCVLGAAERIVNVHIEDIRRGVHEHLPFGEGEMDLPPVLTALKEVGYTGLVTVELPRHSHAAPDLAINSLEFLRSAARQGVSV